MSNMNQQVNMYDKDKLEPIGPIGNTSFEGCFEASVESIVESLLSKEQLEPIMPKQEVIYIINRKIEPSTKIVDIALNMSPLYWKEVFDKSKDELANISEKIHNLAVKDFLPRPENLFRAFDLCPLSKVKVVILGQNPYDTMEGTQPLANGLAFSTSKGMSIGDSCKNIYTEIAKEYPEFKMPIHGELESWALQGVLLLNTCLTVTPHQPANCHIVWDSFIDRVIEAISAVNPTCIYLLLGSKAHKWHSKLGNKTIKLMATHPSPNSAYRGSKEAPAFMGCGHFKTINEHLVKMNKIPINWNSVNE